MSPTWNETSVAARLIRRRMPMDRIIEVLACKFTAAQITDAVIAQRAKARAKSAKLRSVAAPDVMRASDIEPRSDIAIPDHVIADRERRLTLQPSDTTAFLMRDPLPGYSAGERERQSATTITRDPLDGLMFRRRKSGARYG